VTKLRGQGINGECIEKLRQADPDAYRKRYPEHAAMRRKQVRESNRRRTRNGVWRPGGPGRPPVDPSADEYLKERA
jgi:hypothetical protein